LTGGKAYASKKAGIARQFLCFLKPISAHGSIDRHALARPDGALIALLF
jgi:hypothetical protein